MLKKSFLYVKEFKLLTIIKIVFLLKLITLQDIICWIIHENLIKNLKKYESALRVRVYCGGKNHIWTGCNIITHIETRRNILKKLGRWCFLYLSKGHLRKHCKVKYSCAKCGSKNRNVSICDKINEKNHDAKER